MLKSYLKALTLAACSVAASASDSGPVVPVKTTRCDSRMPVCAFGVMAIGTGRCNVTEPPPWRLAEMVGVAL